MDAAQMLKRQRPNKKIAPPRWKLITAIHRESRRRDRRRPIDQRLLEPRALRIRRNIGTGIVHAISDDRPTIVPARHDDVQFIAAARTMLCFVQPPTLYIEDQALLVAMAPSVDFRTDGSLSDEWIILRHAAVSVQADNLPEIGRQVLRFLAIFESFADGERERTVGEEGHSPTVVVVCILQRHCLEDHVQILERAAVEARAPLAYHSPPSFPPHR